MKDQLKKLREFVSSTSGQPYVPTSRDFLHIDRAQILRKYKYDQQGRERGKQELPPSDASQPDSVEREIKAQFQGDLATNAQILSDELATFTDRVGALRLNRVPNIKGVVKEASGDFRTEIANGINELTNSRRNVSTADKDFEKFKKDNRLDRPAMFPTDRVLSFALIFGLFAIETGLNAWMIGMGAQGGLTQGLFVSIGISGVNVILLGWLIGAAFSLSHDVYWPKRLSGIFLSLLWMSLLIIINFGVAHYRDAIQNVSLPLDQAGAIAKERLFALQFPADLESAFLFVIGTLACLLAAIKWLRLDDPYPNYGKRARQLEDTRRRYTSEMRDVLGRLGALYAQAQRLFLELKEDLEFKETEYKSVLSARERKAAEFKAAEAHNLSIAQQVVEIYRDENRKSRQSPPPAYFSTELIIDTTLVEFAYQGELSIADVKRHIDDAVKHIDLGMDELSAAWEAAQGKFENLKLLTE